MKKSKFLIAAMLFVLTLTGCATVSEKIESIDSSIATQVGVSIALREVTVKFLSERSNPTEAAALLSSTASRAIEELSDSESVVVTSLHSAYSNEMDKLLLLDYEREYVDQLALEIYESIAGDVVGGTLSPEAAIKVIRALKVIKSAASAYL